MLSAMQEAQRHLQAYKDAVHRARDPNATPAARNQHIAEAGDLAEAHVVSSAKAVAKTYAAESASLPPVPLAVTAQAAQPSSTGPAVKAKRSKFSRAGKIQDKPEQTALRDSAAKSDNALEAPAEATHAAAADDNAEKLDRVDRGASVHASKQGAKKATGRRKTAAAKAAGDTPADAAAADNMAALERAEIGSDAWGSRRETKKAASRRGKSSKGAPVNDMPAEGPAIPAGGKATADNPVAPLHAADSGNDLDDNEASKGAAKAGAGTAIWQADKQRRNRQEQCYRHQGWPCDKELQTPIRKLSPMQAREAAGASV
ncbi:hypothetical protein WJX77_007491 [Trebouxia sp. C0004]